MTTDCGLLVNSSRGIIYASQGEDFAEVAAQKAHELQQEMAAELERIEREQNHKRSGLRICKDTTGIAARHREASPVSTPDTHQAVGADQRGISRCPAHPLPTLIGCFSSYE